jgi:hypothetical protein
VTVAAPHVVETFELSVCDVDIGGLGSSDRQQLWLWNLARRVAGSRLGKFDERAFERVHSVDHERGVAF